MALSCLGGFLVSKSSHADSAVPRHLKRCGKLLRLVTLCNSGAIFRWKAAQGGGEYLRKAQRDYHLTRKELLKLHPVAAGLFQPGNARATPSKRITKFNTVCLNFYPWYNPYMLRYHTEANRKINSDYSNLYDASLYILYSVQAARI